MIPHLMTITPLAESSIHTGRPRYRVDCLACRVVVHEATNAPDIRVREHLEGKEGYSRPMNAAELAYLDAHRPPRASS